MLRLICMYVQIFQEKNQTYGYKKRRRKEEKKNGEEKVKNG